LKLPAVPRADEPELLTVVSENRLIDEPSPWPTTVGGGAFLLGVAPNGEEHLKAQASQSLKPGACGQSAQPPGRDRLVPAAHAREFMARSASKERGKQEADDFAPPLLWGLQAACHLGDQRLGTIQVFEGLMEGLERVLGLSTLLLETFLGFESTAFSGFGLLVSVSLQRGHGELLRTVLVFR
jgi:hypothetical protein